MAVSYTVIYALTDIIYEIRVIQAVFVYKFKKVTCKNLKYLLLRIFIIDAYKKEPSYSTLGKCCVTEVREKGRKKYADVYRIQDGKIYRNVLVQKDAERNSVGYLREICGVKYMK